MRFLLHRTARKGLPKAQKPRRGGGSNQGATVFVGGKREADTHHVTENCGDGHVLQWGQQCSPNCGCVVRFQATVHPETHRYESIDYVARRVITCHSSGRGPTLQTAKGRPMLKDCNCGTLHHLAAQATHHLQGKTTSQAMNMLEFHSTRSSASFRKTALAVQGLPPTDTGCYDVMEEALTAMVKGYMPPFRQEAMVLTNSDHPRVTLLKGRGYHKWKQNDHDEEHGLDFRKFWNDYDVQKFSGPMSTLAMLDLSMSIISGKEDEPEASTALPQDWESYVDKLYEEDKQQSA